MSKAITRYIMKSGNHPAWMNTAFDHNNLISMIYALRSEEVIDMMYVISSCEKHHVMVWCFLLSGLLSN